MIDVEKLKSKYDLVIAFISKNKKLQLTKQDKLHIRLLSYLRIANDENLSIDILVNNNFDEKIFYDKENYIAYYCAKTLKERIARA